MSGKPWIGRRKYRIGKDCDVQRLFFGRVLLQIHCHGSRCLPKEVVFAKRIGNLCAVRDTEGRKGQSHKAPVAHYKNGMRVPGKVRKEYRSGAAEAGLQLSFKCPFLHSVTADVFARLRDWASALQ